MSVNGNLEQQVATVLKELENARTERIRIEASLEAIEAELNRLREEAQVLGCPLEELEDRIQELEEEITILLNQAQESLKQDVVL